MTTDQQWEEIDATLRTLPPEEAERRVFAGGLRFLQRPMFPTLPAHMRPTGPSHAKVFYFDSERV